jgi:hypothetical protein
MQAPGGRGNSSSFLISAVVGGEWSVTPRPRFTLGERTSGTHWIRGRVGLRTGLDTARGKNSLTLPGIEPRSSSLQSDTTLTELRQLNNINVNTYLCSNSC